MGHSTNKVFWISLGAAGFGAIVGIVATAAVYSTVLRVSAQQQVEAVKAQVKAAAKSGPTPAGVRVGNAEVETVQSRFDVVGRLQELQMSTIAAEVEGKVLSVPVEEGDRVKAGKTVLAEIDPVWSDLNLKKAEADINARTATLEKDEADLKLLEKLAAVNSAKPKEVTDKRAIVKADRAALEAAIALRDRVKEQVGRLKIVAPFDGLVVQKMTEEGQWVGPGSSVIKVISDGEIDAVVNVPERYVNLIQVGHKVDVRIDALGMTVKGDVVSVTPMGSSSSRTFPVKVRLADLAGKLMPGMSVTAELPLGNESEQVVVPRDAVVYTTNGPVVWVAAKNPKSPMPAAMKVNVKILFGLEDKVVVAPATAGPPLLVDGAQVVTMGAERIMFPGQPLRIDVIKAPTPATAGKDAKSVEAKAEDHVTLKAG